MSQTLKSETLNLIDGKMLTFDIQRLHYKGKDYNIQIIPGKYKNEVDKCFQELLQLKNHQDNKDIGLGVENGKLSAIDAGWVRGTHPALHYRGNALKRHKVWFQQYGEGFYTYKYTGWQKIVLNATFKIDKKLFPNTTTLVEKMKETCSQNHWIATMYENGNDYIGMHSDKTKTWKKGSHFQVIKWGCPRIFQMTVKDNPDIKKCSVIFRKVLPAGTSITVDMEANEMTRHGVPVMDDKNIGLSGSIVGRDIETLISFEESKKMIAQAKKDRQKRLDLKEKLAKMTPEERKQYKQLKRKKKDMELSDKDAVELVNDIKKMKHPSKKM